MDKYTVKLLPRAISDLDSIYTYITAELLAPEAAENLIEAIEETVFSLEDLPYRYPERKIGIYANKGYRQAFVKNYTLIYRVNEADKTVLILTIRYSKSRF